MRRDPRLAGLSADHHRALVLARSVERRAAAWTLSDGVQLRARFDHELEPHFRIEEELLLPALRAAALTDGPGDAALAALCARLVSDHAGLRANMATAAEGDSQAARAFATKLNDHVRFEERELFPACEERLSSELLDAVARRAPRPSPAR